MDRRTAMWVFVVLTGLLALPGLLLACASEAARTELGRVVPLEAGRPVLVFVYTDG